MSEENSTDVADSTIAASSEAAGKKQESSPQEGQGEWRNQKEIQQSFVKQREQAKVIEKQGEALDNLAGKLDQLMGKFNFSDGKPTEEAAPDFDSIAKGHAKSEVQEMRRELEFRDAFDGVDVDLTPKQKKRIKNMWNSERPDNHDTWLSETISDLGLGTPRAADKEVAQRNVTDTGPATTSDKVIPDDPRLLSKERIDAMSNAEIREYDAKYQRKNGLYNNPWRK